VTVSTSRLAFNDCYDIFDQALADPSGIRVAFESEGAARHFRLRLHQARKIDRQDNAKIYGVDHPMFGRSAYDPIQAMLRQVEGVWYVYLKPLLDAGALKVESLEGMEVPALETPKISIGEVIHRFEPEPLQITFRRR